MNTSEVDPARVEEIRSYLDGLLATPAFSSSRRRGQLLRYLIENKLAGKAEEVSEYGIGLDVFERPASFDPRTEATVRVEVSRLRKALLEHYERGGAADAWRIRIPARGYVASIEPAGPVAAPAIELPAPEPAPAPLPRRGRLLWVAAGVVVVAVIAGIAVARYAFPARQTVRAVAVLPFENLTGDPSKEYLADGVTEQLTDSLAKVPSLRVVARTSSFQFKGKAADIRDIGRRLDADAVVEGSLRYRDGKMRLTVQVNRSANGYHILSKTFDGDQQNLGRLETEMVPAVLAVLRPGASAEKKKAPNPEAYNLLLKARALRGKGTKASFDQAVGYLNQAIERDPTYADAYAALASVYGSGAVNHSSDPLEYAKRARAAAGMALELDPYSALAYSSEGLVDSLVLLEWKRGEQEIRNAIRLMPQGAVSHNRLGIILLSQGKFDEAIAELQTAQNLDPLSGGASVTIGLGYYMARRYDDALRQFETVERLHPDLIAVHPFIGAAWQQKGNFDKAATEYRLAMSKIPDLSQAAPMAILLAVTGKQGEARKLLAVLEHPKPDQPPPNAFDIAAVYAALGDHDSAFHWLDVAYDQRIIWFLKVHPALDPLRGDPRFQQLLGKAGFLN